MRVKIRKAGMATLAGAILALTVFLPGCTPSAASTTSKQTGTTPPTTSTGPNHLTFLQGTASLSVDLFGLVTYRTGTATATFASVFFVHSGPVKWSGTTFSGHLEEAGAGEDITDTVEGSVSADGYNLVSLTYSRVIIRPAVANGTSYTVSLAGVPLASGSNVGAFQLAGAGVQKYVSAIKYADGKLNGTQIVSSFEYVSTDWANTNPSEQPTLKVTFGQ